MEQAVHEVRLYSGMELPIEVLDICAKRSKTVMPPHYHEYIEFLYADRECDIDVWIAGERVQMKTGDMLVINSNAAHAFFNVISVSRYICIKVLPKTIYSSEKSFFDMKYVLPFFENSLVSYRLFSSAELADTDVGKAFCECMTEWDNKRYGYEIALKSLVLRIFLWTVRQIKLSEECDGSTWLDGFDENTRLIQRSVEYINANYAEANETQAAAVANMSLSHYSRQFKAVMGRSFREYLCVTRINAAERLLLTTDMPVTEIALASGFATSSHFIESFKSLKHTTPAKYRQIWLKNQKGY